MWSLATATYFVFTELTSSQSTLKLSSHLLSLARDPSPLPTDENTADLWRIVHLFDPDKIQYWVTHRVEWKDDINMNITETRDELIAMKSCCMISCLWHHLQGRYDKRHNCPLPTMSVPTTEPCVPVHECASMNSWSVTWNLLWVSPRRQPPAHSNNIGSSSSIRREDVQLPAGRWSTTDCVMTVPTGRLADKDIKLRQVQTQQQSCHSSHIPSWWKQKWSPKQWIVIPYFHRWLAKTECIQLPWKLQILICLMVSKCISRQHNWPLVQRHRYGQTVSSQSGACPAHSGCPPPASTHPHWLQQRSTTYDAGSMYLWNVDLFQWGY